MLQQN